MNVALVLVLLVIFLPVSVIVIKFFIQMKQYTEKDLVTYDTDSEK